MMLDLSFVRILHTSPQFSEDLDFYDLYFILRQQFPIPNSKEVFSKVLQTLKKTAINFDAELRQLIPKSHWAIIRDFKSSLERELGRFI